VPEEGTHGERLGKGIGGRVGGEGGGLKGAVKRACILFPKLAPGGGLKKKKGKIHALYLDREKTRTLPPRRQGRAEPPEKRDQRRQRARPHKVV